MTVEEFERRVGEIDRQGTERHAWAMYGLIRQRQPRVVVETGTFAGYVTAHIALALLHNAALQGKPGRVFSVDDYSYGAIDPKGVEANLTRVFGAFPYCVSLVASKSLDWEWPPKVDMAVLDGDRRLPGFAEEVRRALDAGATCLTIHDTHHDPHALLYMRAFRAEMTGWETINCPMRGGLLVAIKTEPGEPTDLTNHVVEASPDFTLPNGVLVTSS
jgi:cephalosporin hydroxylase